MNNYTFLLQVVVDGSMWSQRYESAVEAVRAYDKFVDYGFAKYLCEVVLVEPNNKVHTKSFDARQALPIA
jgi:hypothetical protein